MNKDNTNSEIFPALPLAEWQATRDTLHLWTQIVGKIRMANTPLVNHFWNTTLYLAPRGLTTSAIPYKSGNFEIEFDFAGHQLIITTGCASKTIALEPQTVAEFYRNLMTNLSELATHHYLIISSTASSRFSATRSGFSFIFSKSFLP